MQVMEISLSTVDQVEKFVNIVNKAPFDVNLATSRYTVNAKSLMGVYSLDLSQPLRVIMFCEGEECCGLSKELEAFQKK